MFLFIVWFVVFTIACNKWWKKNQEKDTTISLFLSEGCVHTTRRYFVFSVELSSSIVCYRCTNCLANSVLYSRAHQQGLILYCISTTHWTIIRLCKENNRESFVRKNPLLVLVLVLLELWKLEGEKDILTRTTSFIPSAYGKHMDKIRLKNIISRLQIKFGLI